LRGPVRDACDASYFAAQNLLDELSG
jgi:hypothetical protein